MSDWQTMESAPHDGTWVLLYWPTMTMPINWFPAVGFSNGDGYGWEMTADRDYGEVIPTMWCNIPPLPPNPLPQPPLIRS